MGVLQAHRARAQRPTRQVQHTRCRALNDTAHAHYIFAMGQFGRGVDVRRQLRSSAAAGPRARSTSPSSRARFPRCRPVACARPMRPLHQPDRRDACPAVPEARALQVVIARPQDHHRCAVKRTVVEGIAAMPTAGHGSPASVCQCSAATWHSHTPCGLRTVTSAASTHALPEHQGCHRATYRRHRCERCWPDPLQPTPPATCLQQGWAPSTRQQSPGRHSGPPVPWPGKILCPPGCQRLPTLQRLAATGEGNAGCCTSTWRARLNSEEDDVTSCMGGRPAMEIRHERRRQAVTCLS